MQFWKPLNRPVKSQQRLLLASVSFRAYFSGCFRSFCRVWFSRLISVCYQSYFLIPFCFFNGSSIQAELPQPFFWTDGVREGQIFFDKRIPYKFIAPDDIVYRIFKEGSFFRLEARSYRSNKIQISITRLRNLRQIPLSELRAEIEDGCQTDSIHLTETGIKLQIECLEKKEQLKQDSDQTPEIEALPYYLIRRLEIAPNTDANGLPLIDFFELRSQSKIDSFELQR